MLSSGTRRLIEATADAARKGNDGDRHTVAGGILTASGEILTAMNAHHFTGGPCGEVSALALHAATMPDDPIVAVAAVHGPSGQVISPCGKCRQIFFERNPEICFVVREPAGLVELPVEQLLPNAYSSARLEGPQEMHMAAGTHGLVLSGDKVQAIRVDDPYRCGPAVLIFDGVEPPDDRLPVTITEVRHTQLKDLTDEDAGLAGFTDLAELRGALTHYYDHLEEDRAADVVRFRL